MEIYMTFMLIDIKQELNNLVLQLNTEWIKKTSFEDTSFFYLCLIRVIKII